MESDGLMSLRSGPPHLPNHESQTPPDHTSPLLGSVPTLSLSPDMLCDMEQPMKCICLDLAAWLMLA